MSTIGNNSGNTERKVMIRVSGLKKKYRLGKIGARTLQGAIKEWRAKKKNLPFLSKKCEKTKKMSHFTATFFSK